MATMPTAKYVPAKTIPERFEAALKILESKKRSLIYLYIPELDMKAHQFGSGSLEWVEKLEELESAVSKFNTRLPERSGALLTADHGIIDVDQRNHIYLDEFDLPGLTSVGGDPRVLYLYFDSAVQASLVVELQQKLGSRVLVATKAQIIDAGWFGKVEDYSSNRMPDVFLISISDVALYHRLFAKSKSLKMVGQHGSISSQELTVPLLRFGVFNTKS
jgi:predicted AlkP superfamily pyrophosphatase or phosphodiesterase